MPVLHLTPSMVSSLKCPPGKRHIEYCDTEVKGLMLYCTESERSVPIYKVRVKNERGTNAYPALGSVHDLTLMQARKQAIATKAHYAQLAKEKIVRVERPKSEMTLAEFLNEHYLPFAKMHKRTASKDVGLFQNHIGPRFGHLALHKIQRLDVQVFHRALVEKGLSPATADHNVKLIRRMLNLAVQWDFIEKNQLARIKLFNVDNQIENYLDDDAIQRLVSVLKAHPKRVIALLLMFLLSTGARKASAMYAKWEEIDLVNRVWRIPATNSKSKKVATVPLNDSAVWVLEQLHKEGATGHIFVHDRTGKPYTAIEKTWYEIRKLADIGDSVRIHDLRHTYASLLVTSGRSLYEVQKILSHSDPKITMRYAHLSAKTLQEAANAASVLVPTKAATA